MISENAETEAKIVDAIYRGACDTAEFQRAVEMIGAYFGSAAVALGELDQSQGRCQLMLGSGVMGTAELIRYEEYAHIDPVPPAFSRIPTGTITTSNHILPDSELNGAFVNEYLLPMGLSENVGGPLLRTKERFAAISVLNGVNQDEFGDDAIARLSRLTPHLTRALQIRRLFMQSQARGRALESIVDSNESGMIGMRGDGTVLFVNASVRAMAAARDGISLDRCGRLVAADRGAGTRLTALAADVLRGGAGGLTAVPRRSGHPPYTVLVSPLPAGDDLFPAGVLFAIHDPLRRPIATAQRISQLLRLPPGAAKLVQALLKGLDLKEYAECAGLSINTVRSHLKTAFARTETRSQADLMRVALSALKDLGPHFSDRN
jgi:DNA-binding CsgD family transcriptional regulator